MIQIISFGKIKDKNLSELFLYYTKLCTKYTNIKHVELKDVDRKLDLADLEKFDVEATYILCERGKELATKDFSRLIGKNLYAGAHQKFIIGGAHGFSQNVYQKYQTISLSKLTFPHEMAAVLLAEQLFRSLNLLNGGKYHKE